MTYTRISAKLSDDKKTWKGVWQTGKKKLLRNNEMTLTRSVSKPDWASNVKHIIYKDGIYEAGGVGREPYCKITVKNGRIHDVDYHEKDMQGNIRDENYGKGWVDYFGELAYPGGRLSVEGYHTYGLQLILSQEMEKVDAVTGATNSLNRFKKVVGTALKDAVLSGN